MRYRFFDCYLDSDRHELRRADELVNLSNRAFALLVQLVENRHRSVSRDELEERLWPGHQAIGPEALNGLIRTLRRALGDAGLGRERQQIIRTTYAGGGQRGGYRFTEAVEALNAQLPTGDVAPCAGEPVSATPPTPQPELKQVTVLTCLLSDAAKITPEHLHGQRQRLYRLAEPLLTRHGAVLDRRLDAGFLAVFGTPRAFDDQTIQALHAATALRAGQPGTLRIGLHSGTVLADELITPVNGTFSLALSLAERAGVGEILLSEAVRDRLPSDLQLESCLTHQRTGFSQIAIIRMQAGAQP